MSDLDHFRDQWLKEIKCCDSSSIRKRYSNDDDDVQDRNVDGIKIKTGGGFGRKSVFCLKSNTCLKGNPRAFDIADRLLQGEILTDEDLFTSVRNKRLKCQQDVKENVKHVVDCLHDRPRNSIVDTLISDLNEIDEIPFFDITLPREVAVKIFKHLDMLDLCRCAQVSKSWKSIAEDEFLWYLHAVHSGFVGDTTAVEKENWKLHVKELIQKETVLLKNWKNRIGRLYELEHARGGILSAVHSSEDYIISGYSSGEVKLWRWASFGLESQDISWADCQHLQNGMNSVASVAVNKDNIIVAYDEGEVFVSKTSDPECFHQIISCPETARVKANREGNQFAVHSGSTIILCDSREQTKKVQLQSKVKFISLYPEPFQNAGVISSTDDAINIHSSSAFSDALVLHNLIGSSVTCMDTTREILAFGLIDRTAVNVFQVPLYVLEKKQLLGTLRSHTSAILCVNLFRCPDNLIVTGSCDKNARIFDLRTLKCEVRISAHGLGVSQAQMDEHRLVTGGEDGLVCVWDLRTKAKLWEMFNRHPVRYLRFNDTTLVTAHIPEKVPEPDDGCIVVHKKQRGCLRMYDFSANQLTKGVPSICLSSYDEPAGYNYNVRLAVPYDSID